MDSPPPNRSPLAGLVRIDLGSPRDSLVSPPADNPDELGFVPTARMPVIPSTLGGAGPAGAQEQSNTLGEGRYELRHRLGAGGYGSVYLALDRTRGQEVALKILRPDHTARPAQLMRFRREFRAIARLDHPHCLRVFDEGHDGDRFFFTMEVVDGGDLETLGLLPEPDLLAVLYQIADGLDYIHSRRLVHRDLKPANILLVRGPSRHIKLADFGLARPLDQGTTVTQTGAMIGTIAFMPPEHILGQPSDPRADLYALGCIIYTLCTGKTPFEDAGSPFQILQAHLHTPPAPLTRADNTTPSQALAALAAHLLAKDPQQRPQSAAIVKQVIRQIIGGSTDLGLLSSGELAPSGGGSFIYRPSMIGRESERQRIHALINQVQARAPTAPIMVALCALAGMGKSRLLSAVADDLRAQGWSVRKVSVQTDQSEPFAPFAELERALGDAPDPQDADADPTIDQAVIEDADLLSPSSPETLPGAQTDHTLARRQRAQNLAQRLVQGANGAGVAVLFEDIHDLDPSCEALLVDLLRALEAACAAAPLSARWPLLIASLRPGEARDRLSHQPSARHRAIAWIDLQPLSRADIEQMIAAMMGDSPDVMRANLIDQVLLNTEGNPLFVQAFIQAMIDRGLLHRSSHGSWSLSDDVRIASASVELPDAMARILRDRLQLLSATTLKLLRVAAVVGRRFDSALLQDAAETPQDALLDAIDEALRAWVIQSVPGPVHLDVYEFDHARLVDVLQADLSPSRRRATHDAIARVLQARPDTPPATLAFHLRHSSTPQSAIPHLCAAAQQAQAASDHRSALDLFQAALDLSPTPKPLALLEQCADLLTLIGRSDDAHPLLTQALDTHHPKGTDLARIYYKMGRVLCFTGHLQDGFLAYDRALRALGGSAALVHWRLRIVRELLLMFLRPLIALLALKPSAQSLERLRIRALCHSDLYVYAYWTNLELAACHHFAFYNVARALKEPTFLVNAAAGHGLFTSMFFSQAKSDRVFARAQSIAQSAGLRAASIRTLTFHGIAAAYGGNFSTAQNLLSEALAASKSQGDRFLMGFTSIVYAWTSSLGSRLPDAWELFSYALSNARELRDPRLLCDALIGRASIGLYMGRTQDLLAEIEEVQGICATLYFPAFLGLCEEVKGGLRLLDHDFASACKHFSRAEAIYAQNYLSAAWGFLVHVHHAEALLWLYDQPSQSGLLVRELRQLSKRASIALHRPVFAGFLDLIHACIHARRGRRDRALALLDRAVAVSSAHPFTALPSPHIFHAIIVQRAAVERARLGDPPSVVGPLFERAARITNDAQAYGLRDWIVQIHRRVLPADG